MRTKAGGRVRVRYVDGAVAHHADVFFFSSRRRHTRLQGDWSSDVCSSDLPMIVVMPLGYGDYDVIRRGWGSWSDKDLAWRNLSRFTDILLTEVKPQIEQRDRKSVV